MSRSELEVLYGVSDKRFEGYTSPELAFPELAGRRPVTLRSEPLTPTSVLKDVTEESITPVALSKSFDRVAADDALIDTQSTVVSDTHSHCKSI